MVGITPKSNGISMRYMMYMAKEYFRFFKPMTTIAKSHIVRNSLMIIFWLLYFLNSFKRILLLPYNYYKNKTTGEIISRVNDLSYIKQIISQLLTTVFLDIVLLLFSLVCLYFINSKMFVISFFIAILYVIIIFIYPRFIKYLNLFL